MSSVQPCFEPSRLFTTWKLKEMSYLSPILKVIKKLLLLLRLCLAEGFRRGRHEFQMSLLFGKFYNEGNVRLQCVTPNKPP